MILDVILIAIILLSILVGFHKGFIKMLASFMGKFIALGIAYFYYAPFKTFLIKFTNIDNYVFDKIKLSLSNLGGHAAEASIAGSDIDALSKMALPDSIKKRLVDYLTESANSLGKSVTSSLTDFIMTIVSFFILFLIVAILISIVVRLLDIIAKLPVLNSFNKIGGIMFSLITSYILITIFFLLITSFMSMDLSSNLNNMIQNSVIAKGFIIYNPILIGLANINL